MRVLIILLAIIMLSGCGNAEVRGELIEDTEQLLNFFWVASITEDDLDKHQEEVFRLYEEKYIDLNNTEQQLKDKALELRELFINYRENPPKLDSEPEHIEKYGEARRELADLIKKYKDE
jgi:hypothetical protein